MMCWEANFSPDCSGIAWLVCTHKMRLAGLEWNGNPCQPDFESMQAAGYSGKPEKATEKKDSTD